VADILNGLGLIFLRNPQAVPLTAIQPGVDFS
jgi:hypothetical protein